MSISRIVDNRQYKRKSDTIKCMKNLKECMFLNKDECTAEWCIFERLPKMVTLTKKINCIICDKPKEVSVYTGQINYICDDCVKKIKEKINE